MKTMLLFPELTCTKKLKSPRDIYRTSQTTSSRKTLVSREYICFVLEITQRRESTKLSSTL
jgi:hypothetical protein